MVSPGRRGGPRLCEVFREAVGDFIAERRLPASHLAVLRDVSRCRTAAMGGHLQVCLDCEHRKPAYNSCRNRHCPTCQSGRQRAWLEARQARVLPTHHYHVVFTLPSELRVLARLNPTAVYDALFAAASRTLLTLGEQRLGGQLGITAVLHTWTRDLRLHPHLHCVVTGGALGRGETPTWTAARRNFLFPVAVMRDLFRGKLMARLQRLRNAGRLRLPDDLVHDRDWRAMRRALFAKPGVVFAKRPFGGPKQVFAYLGRYTHRVAISSARLKAWDGHCLRIRTRGDRTVELTREQFLTRFLLHVLPRGFRKIRHFGLHAPAGVGTRLEVARRCLGAVEAEQDEPVQHEALSPLRCPACGGVVVCMTGILEQDMPDVMDSS